MLTEEYKAYEINLPEENNPHYILCFNNVLQAEVNLNNFDLDKRFTALKSDFQAHRMLQTIDYTKAKPIGVEFWGKLWRRALSANEESYEDSYYCIKPDSPLHYEVWLHYKGQHVFRMINPYISNRKLCWGNDETMPETIRFDMIDAMVNDKEANVVEAKQFNSAWLHAKKCEDYFWALTIFLAFLCFLVINLKLNPHKLVHIFGRNNEEAVTILIDQKTKQKMEEESLGSRYLGGLTKYSMSTRHKTQHRKKQRL